jgi:hypothetical protein
MLRLLVPRHVSGDDGIEVVRGRLDWEGLRQVGEFDPTYLHLHHEAAA